MSFIRGKVTPSPITFFPHRKSFILSFYTRVNFRVFTVFALKTCIVCNHLTSVLRHLIYSNKIINIKHVKRSHAIQIERLFSAVNFMQDIKGVP